MRSPREWEYLKIERRSKDGALGDSNIISFQPFLQQTENIPRDRARPSGVHNTLRGLRKPGGHVQDLCPCCWYSARQCEISTVLAGGWVLEETRWEAVKLRDVIMTGYSKDLSPRALKLLPREPEFYFEIGINYNYLQGLWIRCFPVKRKYKDLFDHWIPAACSWEHNVTALTTG